MHHNKSAIAGFSAGFIMWIVEVSGVNIPVSLLIIFGTIASGAFLYGVSPLFGWFWRYIMKLRFQSPIINTTRKKKPEGTDLKEMPTQQRVHFYNNTSDM